MQQHRFRARTTDWNALIELKRILDRRVQESTDEMIPPFLEYCYNHDPNYSTLGTLIEAYPEQKYLQKVVELTTRAVLMYSGYLEDQDTPNDTVQLADQGIQLFTLSTGIGRNGELKYNLLDILKYLNPDSATQKAHRTLQRIIEQDQPGSYLANLHTALIYTQDDLALQTTWEDMLNQSNPREGSYFRRGVLGSQEQGLLGLVLLPLPHYEEIRRVAEYIKTYYEHPLRSSELIHLTEGMPEEYSDQELQTIGRIKTVLNKFGEEYGHALYLRLVAEELDSGIRTKLQEQYPHSWNRAE